MTTTNVEKLVYNIFERKNWIIEQIKQQTYLYEQQLASNLLIQGINPPPWFLTPNLHSLSSDPKVPNKEELISDLLLPPARPTFPYSTGQCYLQSRLIGTGDNNELLDKLPNDIQGSNKGPDAEDDLRLVHESHGNDVGYTSDCVPRLSHTYSHDRADVEVSNISIKSGQSPGISQTSQLVFAQDGEKAYDESRMVVGASNKGLDGGNERMNSVPKCSSTEQTEVRISNIDIAPDQSLARLQRSKSRQKALELRTSGKATKSRLSDENKRISFSAVTGVAIYGIDLEEPDHYKGLLKMDKSSNTNKGSSGKRVASGDLSNKNGTSNNCGRMTRSRSTCQRPSSVNEPSKLDISCETVREHSGKENCVISQSEGIDLSMENGTSGYCGQIKRSKSSCIQDICPNESLEICRTSTVEYEDGGSLSQLMDYDHQPVGKEIEGAIPFHISKENSDKREEAAMEASKVREQESSKYLGSMTRSMNFSRQHSSVNDAVELGASYHIPEVDGGTLGESTSNNCGRMTRSRSTCQRPSSVNEPSKLDVSCETVREHSGKENCVISQSEGIDLSVENGTSGYCGQIKRSKSSCIQDICPNESLEICRTSTVEYEDGGSLSQLMDYDHQPVGKEIEGAVPFHISKENSDKREEAAMEASKVREQESSKYLGSMTRSMSSSRQHSSVNDAVGLGASYHIPEVDGGTLGESTGILSQKLDKANEVLEVVKPSPKVDYINNSSKDTCHSNELVSSAKSFGTADLIVTHSRYDATEGDPLVSSLNRSDEITHKDLSGSQLVLPVTKSSAIFNQEAKVIVATAIELEGNPPRLGSNLDAFNIRTESEGLVVRLASDAHFVVKPKQLDFNVLEDCSLNEHYSLPSAKRSPQQYLQRTCHKSLEPESLENSTSDYPSKVSLEMQLLAQSEACKGKKNAPMACETNMEECNEITTTLEAFIDGNHQVNHAEDGSDLHKSSYRDMHQHNCYLTEGCVEQRIDEGNFCCERWTASEIIPLASQQQCSGSSAVPSLARLVTEDPKCFLDEEVNMKNQPDDVLDARRCCSVDDKKELLQHKHKFDSENIDTLASTEKMSLADGSNNLTEEGLNTSGDPQNEYNNFGSLEFGEAQPTFTSSLPKNRFRHKKIDSWPQLKRRKIDYQQTNCSSATASLREHKLHNMQGGHISSHSKTAGNDLDAVPKLLAFSSSREQNGSESSDTLFEKMECHLTDGTFSSPILKSQQEDGKFCFTEQIKVVQTPFSSEHKELGPCFVSSLSKQATRESQGPFVENYTTSYSPDDILAAKNLCDEQKFQKIFHVRCDGDLEDADILTSSRSVLLDCDPHLKEGGPVGSPCNNELAFDQNLPVYEGFVLDEHSDNGELDASRDEINFSELNTTRNSLQRASILEQICRNASMCTPLVHFSSTYKPLKNKDLCLSVPTRLLEHTDLTSTLSFSEDAGNHLQATSMDEVDSALREMLYCDSLPYSGAQYSWNAKNCDTPVGRYCKRITSSLINSEKRLSSNPELTCFRIEEDSCVIDENENADDDDHILEDIGLAETNSCANGEPLSETIEVFSNPPAAKKLYQIGGIDYSNAEIQSSVKQRLRSHCSNNKSKNLGKENQLSSVGANSSKVSESLHNRFSKAKLSSTTSIKRGTQRLSEKVKRNNIVSNVTSFVPLVKQNQEAAVCKGKRDIKVRALEAAEAVKRQEEKKENERRIKKEALKLERAKIEQETLRQRELDKRKKEEELKKKEADLAARKRLREEEGRKEKEKKRKRIVGWQSHRAQEEKIFAGKGEKEKRCGNTGKSTNIRKESNSRTGKDQQVDKLSRDGNTLKKPESQTEFKGSRSNIQEVSIVPENCEILGNCDGSTKSTSMLDQLSSKSGVGTKTTHEKSYEMSPYQHSDDEEEEEDEVPTKKFIPSWASKNCVALVLSSQQQIDPSVIFPRESFCSMNEVLLPRHLQ